MAEVEVDSPSTRAAWRLKEWAPIVDDALASIPEDVLTLLLSYLTGSDIVRLGMTNKQMRVQASDERLWGEVLRCSFSYRHFVLDRPRSDISWVQLYRENEAMLSLQFLEWESGENEGRSPGQREGHMYTVLQGQPLIHGGFGRGIHQDVWAVNLEEWPSVTYQYLPVVGETVPHPCYGGTLTAVGDQAVSVGGMLFGGYQGELDAVWSMRMENVAQDDGSIHRCVRWQSVELDGHPMTPRGYHTATASLDESFIAVFGGISQSEAIADLVFIHVDGWRCEEPATTGAPPAPRFGASVSFIGEHMWVVGGGNGGDLLRDGVDLASVHSLHLPSLTWTEVSVRGELEQMPRWIGRCHTGTVVADKIVIFGGSRHTSDRLVVLDTSNACWQLPSVRGERPLARHCQAMWHFGKHVYFHGGWGFGSALDDVHRLNLCVLDQFEDDTDYSFDADDGEDATRYYHDYRPMRGMGGLLELLIMRRGLQGGMVGFAELLRGVAEAEDVEVELAEPLFDEDEEADEEDDADLLFAEVLRGAYPPEYSDDDGDDGEGAVGDEDAADDGAHAAAEESEAMERDELE
eukprot:PLAT8610.2.p1 GENE.PLAT8610.2~~PLAT8610.2.p1  ORF type:complete len:576 (-),score=205.79 PLAT8610.2:111-1838(-)